MDDEWDDNDTPAAVTSSATQGENGGGYARDGGRSFTSKGRGFSAKPTGGNDGWGSSSGRDFGGSGRPNRNGHDTESGGSNWGNSNSDGNNDGGGWNGDDDRPRRGGGRGRGGRGGGRGGRGGSYGDRQRDGESGDGEGSWGGNKRDNDDGGGGGGWGGGGDDGDDDGGFRGGRGRGRGGRGGGRGRREDGDRGDRPDGNKDENGEVKREIYVPPEPTSDENELFNSGITTGINFSKLDDIEIQTSGENVPRPIKSFEEAGLRELLLENVRKSGYTKPTPIQKNSLPIILGGRDLMACAQTGSGKTAAFLLPIINTLLEDPVDLIVDAQHTEPQAVIVSPTRELAIQIFEEARKFSYNSSIKVVITYGGTSVGYQRRHVENGCHILVTTPGRMSDFVNKGIITFASTRFVVLDEADRMLDMGFLPSMEEMLGHATMVPTGERRTLMFSATFPEEIQRLAAKFLHNYIFVTVGIVGSACKDVEQIFHQVDKFNKRNKLVEIFKAEGTEGTLVFVETKRNADFLATYLSENDFKTTSIHGDRLQREREEALRDFKQGRRNILVATAVAARGLDIKNVKHVINYDLPKSIDEYVHRIGRTGRVGNRGKASSFYDESQDGAMAGNLTRILKQAGQTVPEWLRSTGGTYDNSSFGGRDVREDEFAQPKAVEVDDEAW